MAFREFAEFQRQRGAAVFSGDPMRVPLALACAAVLVVFAVRSHDRAALWSDELALTEVSAAYFPDGLSAAYLRAREAATRGDTRAAIAALTEAKARSQAAHRNYYADPALAALRPDPLFLEFARQEAGSRIAFARDNGYATQHWLRVIAHDHLLRGELEAALAAFEEALRAGGPRSELVLTEVGATREMVLAQRRGEPIPQHFELPGHRFTP